MTSVKINFETAYSLFFSLCVCVFFLVFMFLLLLLFPVAISKIDWEIGQEIITFRHNGIDLGDFIF